MLAVLYSHFFWIFGTFHCAFASYGNYNLNIYLHVYTRNDARNFNYRYCILFVGDSFLYSNQGTLLGLANLVDIVLGQTAAFLLKLLLCLAILCQVDGSNFFSLLNLLLVGLDLLLQFVHQLRDPILVVLVLVSLEHQFLHPPLAFSDGFMKLGSSLNSSGELQFNFPGPAFKLHWQLLGTKSSLNAGILSTVRQVFQNLSSCLYSFLLGSVVVLLCTKFISQPSSINHGFLGLLFCCLRVAQQVIQISLHLLNVIFHLAFLVAQRSVGRLHVIHLLTGVAQLLLNLPLTSNGSIQKSFRFLQFSSHSIALPVSQSKCFLDLIG